MEDLIQLGLNKAEHRKRKSVNTFSSLVSELLSLLAAQVVEDEIPGAEGFRATLTSYRAKLSKPGALNEDTATTCLEECESYFSRARAYSQGREAEINELIELLRTALKQFTGDSATFNNKMVTSADRLTGLSRLEDIRELKLQIANEVRDLRQTVLEKQQYDERNYSKLSKRIETLQSKLQLAREEALTDPLTQIANRGAFDRAIHRFVEKGTRFVLAIVDVDQFKAINDTHGHPVGDGVLCSVAQWLGENLSSTDVLARLGGDEFVILLSGTDMKLAERGMSATLAEIASRSYVDMAGGKKRTVKFTLSCGLAEFASGDTVDGLIQRADYALRQAKRQRNRVCMAPRALASQSFR